MAASISTIGIVHVDSSIVADLRELSHRNEFSGLEKVKPSGFSISAVVELSCIRLTGSASLRSILDGWALQSPILQHGFAALETGVVPRHTDIWASKGVEFFPIRGRDWASEQFYHPFESRFCKAAKEAGFGNMAVGLTGALFEMADNVVQHSSANGASPAHALVGYHVESDHVAFAIGDIGRGCLASLHENPTWLALPNSKAALLAIIEKNASRRPHGGDGEGFKEIFRSFANLNGIVELRSHDGRVTVVKTTAGRAATPQFTGFASGFQISVACSLSGEPREAMFPFDYLT